MQQYKKIEIFTSEEARRQGQPLYAAIVQEVRDLKIAARCLVTRGIGGSDQSGEITTARLEVLSYNMPVRITIIVPAFESERGSLSKTAGDGDRRHRSRSGFAGHFP